MTSRDRRARSSGPGRIRALGTVLGCLALGLAAPPASAGEGVAYDEPGTYTWAPEASSTATYLRATIVGGGGGGGGGHLAGGGGGGSGALIDRLPSLVIPPDVEPTCTVTVGHGGSAGGNGGWVAIIFLFEQSAAPAVGGGRGGESALRCTWTDPLSGEQKGFTAAARGGPGGAGANHRTAGAAWPYPLEPVSVPGAPGTPRVPECWRIVFAGAKAPTAAGGAGGALAGYGVPQNAGRGGGGGSGNCATLKAQGTGGVPGGPGFVEITQVEIPHHDPDDDGIPSGEDNCWAAANPDQRDRDRDGLGDACDPTDDTDSDDDGLPDVSDFCPHWPGGDFDSDGDGRGDECDADRDGDGVDNTEDTCPDAPNPGAGQTYDIDRDGTPNACDPDVDGDAIDDADDNCPGIANHDQADADGNGTGDACEPDEHGPEVRDDLESGLWHNRDVEIGLSAVDRFQGVAAILHGLDGGENEGVQFPEEPDPLRPVHTIVTVPAAGNDGTHTFEYLAVDRAGVPSLPRSTTVRIDTIPPQIAVHSRTPANADGWNDGDVTVAFACSDQDTLSGVAFCQPPYTVTTEGAGLTVGGGTYDRAGNEASITATGINIDRTPPSVTYDGNAGVYSIDQTVHITCRAEDALSGVRSDTCEDLHADAVTLGEGVHSYRAEATDRAGNSGSGQAAFLVVVDSLGLLRLARAEAERMRAAATWSRDRDALGLAAAKLGEAVSGAWWADASHLRHPEGARAFELTREAVDRLDGLLGDDKSQVDRAALRTLIGRAVDAARRLAATALAEAQGSPGANASRLEQARKRLEEGDQRAAEGRHASAIGSYGDAWALAHKATS